jgi:ubiquinol-cytochrome c reductase cytochrome b subunit
VLGTQTDGNGVAAKHARSERIRAKLSHFYFKDRVAPVTPAELAAAHHHGEHEAIASPETSGSLEGAAETQGLALPTSEREAVKRAPEKDL